MDLLQHFYETTLDALKGSNLLLKALIDILLSFKYKKHIHTCLRNFRSKAYMMRWYNYRHI